MSVYAHSKENAPLAEWQLLEAHLEGTAKRAEIFAAPFSSSTFGRLIGLLHDIGKSRSGFQSYLRRCNDEEEENPDYGDHAHAIVGACYLNHTKSLGQLAKALAYCVAGHHAGLPDWSGGETPNGALVVRLAEESEVLEEVAVREWISAHESNWYNERLQLPFQFCRNDSSLSFWIRMMYSCLVDADFLDTEAFMDSSRADMRLESKSLEDLSSRFFNKLDEKQKSAIDTPVNKLRAEIRSACEGAAEDDPGFFSLTVPTGGGKTLSGTAFAFKHALKHGQKRIIYVIPYTSIIEQTADVLRAFIGFENVLEHHSNFDSEKETPQSRLASENWDAPVIVTTAVQFFESLYACKSSRCRKLHNIAESVVILDEVQLLPTKLLLPCVESLRQLTRHYHVSVVLSTATQLNLPGIGVGEVREIISPSMDLYRRLKRTEIEFPADLEKRRSWEEIASELVECDQVLCIVNTRRDCHDLFQKMPEGTIHLSASMCGEHRSKVILEIKSKLANGESVRVVSTQLVEAGVDVDFPVVYRAFSGLSSIAQSAGRCNREGLLCGNGRVVVFVPPEKTPVKDLCDGEYAMMDLLDRENGVNPDDASLYPKYFKALHSRAHDLGVAFERWLGVYVPNEYLTGARTRAEPLQYQFREASTAFKMIDSAAQVSIVVRYGESDGIIGSLRAVGPKRDIMRKLQRFTVNVPRGSLRGLLEKGLIEELCVPPCSETPSGIFVQTAPNVYRNDIGFDLFGDGLKTEDFIV